MQHLTSRPASGTELRMCSHTIRHLGDPDAPAAGLDLGDITTEDCPSCGLYQTPRGHAAERALRDAVRSDPARLAVHNKVHPFRDAR